MAIPEEYKIIRKVGFSRANIVYFLSRRVFYDKIHSFSCSMLLDLELLVIV
jgi:hypothetical protein